MKTKNLFQLKTVLLLVFLVFGIQKSMAQQSYEVKSFKNNSSWSVGDRSQTTVLFGEIRIRFDVKKSSNQGRHYYVARIENISDRKISFGARLTDTNPTSSQFRITLEPGEVKTWGEHLSSNADIIYFLATPPR